MPHEALPLYQSHKRVRACQIGSLVRGQYPGAVLVPSDTAISPFHISQGYVDKHAPYAGGWFVAYPDGYESFSPNAAFTEGYTLVDTSPAFLDAARAFREAVQIERKGFSASWINSPTTEWTFANLQDFVAALGSQHLTKLLDMVRERIDAEPMRGTHWKGEEQQERPPLVPARMLTPEQRNALVDGDTREAHGLDPNRMPD